MVTYCNHLKKTHYNTYYCGNALVINRESQDPKYVCRNCEHFDNGQQSL